MQGWERVLYILGLVLARAFWDVYAARERAMTEVSNEDDAARRRRFADAIRKLRAQASEGPAGPKDPSPGS